MSKSRIKPPVIRYGDGMEAVGGKGYYQNERPSNDDSLPGDLEWSSARDGRDAAVTKTREHAGLTLERRDPFGLWHIRELDLGTFTTESAAMAAIDEHIAKNNKEKVVE